MNLRRDLSVDFTSADVTNRTDEI